MVSEVDAQLGRVWDALRGAGAWDETFIVVTSDHGEQLGDHGLIGKGGFFEESYHVVGLVRDPRPNARRGLVVERFTENIDLFPTLCEAMGLAVPAQCDGLPLTPILAGGDRRGGARPRIGSSTRAPPISAAAARVAVGPAPRNAGPCVRRGETPPTCTSATAHGSASTSPPTRPGARRSPIPGRSCAKRRRC